MCPSSRSQQVHVFQEWGSSRAGEWKADSGSSDEDVKSVFLGEEGAEPDGSLYWSLSILTVTYGHELRVMTKRIRSQILGGLLNRIAEISLRERVKSLVTREQLGLEPLLLRINRKQLRCLLGCHAQPGGRPGADLGHAGGTMSPGWPGNLLGWPQKSW